MRYKYLCKNPDCNLETEIVHSIHDDTITKCPECKQETFGRVIGAPHLSAKMGLDPNSAQGNRWAKMHRDEAKRENAKIDPNPSS